MYEIVEKSYFPNQKDGLVVVSFGLPYRDWCELQKLDCWERISEFLHQKETVAELF